MRKGLANGGLKVGRSPVKLRRGMLQTLALLLALSAPLAAQGRLHTEPVRPAGPAAARLGTVVLSLQSPTAPSLTAPTLALPSAAPVPTPAAFAALADPAAAARLAAVTRRLAPAAAAPAALAAPAAIPAPSPADRAEAAGQERAAADPEALAAADGRTAVDLKELSAAVESVLGGFSPDQIGTMSDEAFNDGAERILAAMEGRTHAGRAKGYGPAAPESVAAYLKDVAPELERLTIAKYGMDHDKPDSFAACGPVSLAAREALRADLRRRFPGSPHLDVLLEPGRLDGPGEPVLHVFLKIVDRASPNSLPVTPLAVFDLTAAQKPGNLTALGQDPRRQAALILPWRSDLYETAYPFSRPAARDAAHMIERIEKARGPLSRELEAEMRKALAARP